MKNFFVCSQICISLTEKLQIVEKVGFQSIKLLLQVVVLCDPFIDVLPQRLDDVNISSPEIYAHSYIIIIIIFIYLP